jgi:hypothetical protein
MNKLGCLKDKFDERDYLMRAYLPAARGFPAVTQQHCIFDRLLGIFLLDFCYLTSYII